MLSEQVISKPTTDSTAGGWPQIAGLLVAGVTIVLTAGDAFAVSSESELVAEIQLANDSETEDNGGENNNVRAINNTSSYSISGSLPTVTQSISLNGAGVTVSGGTLNIVDNEILELGDNFTFDGTVFISGNNSRLVLGDGSVVTSANGNEEARLILDFDSNTTIGSSYWDSFNDFATVELIEDTRITIDQPITLDADLVVSDGTLIADADNVFQTDQQLSINGAAEFELRGTDQTIGSLTGGGDIDLGNDSASVFTIGADDENANFTGEISGDGGLVKIGDGDQNLSGELEYLGDTRVQDGELIISGTLTESNVFVENGGTLVLSDSSPNSGDDNVENDVFVEDGGILYGSGSIGNDLENAGLIDFEEGNNNRLVIDGDYTQTNDGEFLVQVGANGSAGSLAVDGVATLDGTLEIVSDDDEDQFNPSTEYVLLTAEGGIVGEWSNIEEDFAFLDATVVYEERDDNDGDGDEARLTLSRNDLDFIDTAETSNQAAVSGALSRVVGTAEDELATVIGIVETLNGDDSRDAYDALSGAQLATVQSTALVSLQRQHNLLADRAQFIAFNASIAEPADTPTALISNRLQYTNAMHPSVEMFRNQNATDEPVEAPKQDLWSNASPWGRIYSGDNEFDGEGGSGVELDLEGVVLGVDWFGNGTPWAVGLAVGLETGDYAYDDRSGDGENETLYISGYAKRELGDYRLTGIATLAYGDNESTRLVDVGGSIGIAESDFDSYSLALSVEASRPYFFDYDGDLERPRAVVEPFVRASYAGTFQNAYEEDRLGTAGLDVDSNYLDSFRVYAGARGEWVVDTLFPLEFVFQGRAMVGAALIDEQSNLDVAFVDTPGSGFTVEGAEASNVFGVLGVGLAMPVGERAHAFLNYDEEVSDEGSGSLISLGLRIVF